MSFVFFGEKSERYSMLHINEVELYFEPREKILGKLSDLHGEPEMNENESAFLCGIIRKYKPRKIVEVGIAGGGTSAIILSCMKSLSMDSSILYSVDYSKKFYRDSRYESGFLGKEAREILGIPEGNHKLLTGNIACSFDELKDGVDLLIIDTMHTLPGELLDFITLLPALKEGAIVVLHDIALAYMLKTHKTSIATNVLFACSSGEKYINTFDFSDKYSNIGAIRVNNKTREDIVNVFLGLFVPWGYRPDDVQIAGYRSIVLKKYPDLLRVFDSAVNLNDDHLNNKYNPGWLFPFGKIMAGSRIVLFGTGEVGAAFVKQLEKTRYCEIAGIVDNDKTRWNTQVGSPDIINNLQFDYVIIAIGNENTADIVIEQLSDMGVPKEKIVWDNYYVFY